MKRLLIEIGDPGGFLMSSEIDFRITISTEKINKEMIEDILSSLKQALEQEIE